MDGFYIDEEEDATVTNLNQQRSVKNLIAHIWIINHSVLIKDSSYYVSAKFSWYITITFYIMNQQERNSELMPGVWIPHKKMNRCYKFQKFKWKCVVMRTILTKKFLASLLKDKLFIISSSFNSNSNQWKISYNLIYSISRDSKLRKIGLSDFQ